MTDAISDSDERLAAARRLALRAVMDGRGVDAVILSSPRSLAHYAGRATAEGMGRLLVVTARRAVPVAPGGTGDPSDIWAAAAALLPPGCALGYEGEAVDDAALAVLGRLAGPRRMLSISADVTRQIDGG